MAEDLARTSPGAPHPFRTGSVVIVCCPDGVAAYSVRALFGRRGLILRRLDLRPAGTVSGLPVVEPGERLRGKAFRRWLVLWRWSGSEMWLVPFGAWYGRLHEPGRVYPAGGDL